MTLVTSLPNSASVPNCRACALRYVSMRARRQRGGPRVTVIPLMDDRRPVQDPALEAYAHLGREVLARAIKDAVWAPSPDALPVSEATQRRLRWRQESAQDFFLQEDSALSLWCEVRDLDVETVRKLVRALFPPRRVAS